MITLSHVANASAQGVQVRCFVPSHLQVCNLSSSSTLHPQLFDSRKSFIMRSYKISPVTPLECADPKTPRRNSFRMRSYKKSQGGGGVPVRMARHSNVLFAFNSGPRENLARHAARPHPARAFGVYQFRGPRKPVRRRPSTE